jgi:flagellar biosynthesis protein FliQ
MTEGMVLDIATKAALLVIYLSAPVLGFGLAAGVAVAIFQAVTSIQEMTLTFIPKIVAVIVAMVLFGNWMLEQMMEFTAYIFGNLHTFVR